MKGWNPQAVIALILAITAFCSISGAIMMPWIMGAGYEYNPDRGREWKDVMLIILGALAGFIGGQARDEGVGKDD